MRTRRFIATREKSYQKHCDGTCPTNEACLCGGEAVVSYCIYDTVRRQQVCSADSEGQVRAIRDLLNKQPQQLSKFQDKLYLDKVDKTQLLCKKHKYYGHKKPSFLCETCFEGWKFIKKEIKEARENKEETWQTIWLAIEDKILK